ncbi:MAG: hypothetical protein JJU36_12255 [Phycisphaeraceae bacterium]|nr:hypothetical protein [Phycisphaeraceae bacterium]
MLRFANLYHWVDAFMLCGARIAPTNPGSDLYTLGLARSNGQWPFLAWAITVAEVHGYRMRLCTGPTAGESRIGYKTTGHCTFGHAFERWYPVARPRLAVTPADIELTERIFAVWIAGSLSRRDRSHADDPVVLRAPRLGMEVVRHLAVEVESLGFSPNVIQTEQFHGLAIDGAKRHALAGIAALWVPARVFGPVL